jgi:hypothetical protein
MPVRIYSIARTIADCFKFRNKIGLDVALEALRLARQRKRLQNREAAALRETTSRRESYLAVSGGA